MSVVIGVVVAGIKSFTPNTSQISYMITVT